MKIKIKFNKTLHHIDDIEPTCTLNELKIQIMKCIGCDSVDLKLRFNYPPTLLDTSDNFQGKGDQKTVTDYDLQQGDVIHVDILKPLEELDLSRCLKIEKVAADNSCLFNSICILIPGESRTPSQLRTIISEYIQMNPDVYTMLVLGKSIDDYCDWINLGNSWGGYIELSIFSKLYRCQFVVFDTHTVQAIRLGDYEEVAYLNYNGIHYNPIVLNTGKSKTTIFKVDNESIFNQAQQLTIDQNSQVATKKIKCSVCQVILNSQFEAKDHSNKTNHYAYEEV
ncbi:Ubiquitin thioesterase OTU1 [Intoshia linei]|uniref:Ubiquitin thioesterase OTU n=1 Tax=Intoshia linei TaxID=1819745 RepID=A0A177B3L8_9BILA|nr:Ubiquitin thioesterase OTU1 [Intoshia linei]